MRQKSRMIEMFPYECVCVPQVGKSWMNG